MRHYEGRGDRVVRGVVPVVLVLEQQGLRHGVGAYYLPVPEAPIPAVHEGEEVAVRAQGAVSILGLCLKIVQLTEDGVGPLHLPAEAALPLPQLDLLEVVVIVGGGRKRVQPDTAAYVCRQRWAAVAVERRG